MALTDNVKLDVYKAVRSALKEMDTIKKVIHYNGQDDDRKKNKSHNFPAVYISFGEIAWDTSRLAADQSNLTAQQQGKIIIDIRLETFSLKGDDDTFEDDLALINSIYRKLTNLRDGNFQALQRVSENDETDNDNVRTWLQTFSTMGEEAGVSAGEELKTVTVIQLDKIY